MKKHLSFLLILTMLCTIVGQTTSTLMVQASYSAELDKEAEALEKKKQNALNQIKELKAGLSTVQNKISDLKKNKSNLQTYITQLDAQVNDLNAQIVVLEEEIEVTKKAIEERTKELAEAQEELEEQYDTMKLRIRYLYEQGDQSFFVLLLSSENLTDALNRTEYAYQMSDYDHHMMEKLVGIRNTIEEKKIALEEEKKKEETLLAEVEEEKAAVDAAIEAKTKEVAAYQSQIDNAEGDQAEYEKQLKEQNRLLQQVESQIATNAAARAAAADGDGGASGFMWPCPASHRITSTFGNRKAPTAGASTNHKGLDIGAPTGTAIVAAYSGRVTTAAYSSSAGNYIVISHGGGISTVYMHCSALYVSEGAKVSKGQKIAAVGSTGFSTGPHLHFGVIKNGSYVNPLGYVH